MALTDKQLEIISDALLPLFQYLEREVIADVAKRIKHSLAYTRTAELKAESMQRLGYSPAVIRKEAMKLLKSDPEFRKMVAKNTLEHKKEVKKLLKDIEKEILKQKDQILSDTADMSYFDDLRIWKEGGKELADDSFLPQLVEAMQKQTAAALKNLTGTTGFKTMSGFEAIEDLYRRELDKAMIKVCTGTYTHEKVVYEVVHDLSTSGLRSIDFSSGYTMQLDTAVKLAMRTGAHQMAGKVTDGNIICSGENLVYVSKHWGARNTGVGHANHEQWQGKVYFIKEGQDYSEEAKRIGQDSITDLWYATGYSVDGAHENDPLGLEGYNCRHRKYPWFIGISELPDEDPEPAPVTINGKEYDYYAVTQKMRAKEREIRALKREREAMKSLNMDTKEVQKEINSKIREYNDFCKDCKVNPQINRLRYESGTSDLKKTKAWKDYKAAASDSVRNTGRRTEFNPEYDYSVKLDGYSEVVNEGLSKACRKVAELGGQDHNEHMYLVDLQNGDLSYYETNGMPNEVGYEFRKYLLDRPDKIYAFVHNHNTDGMFSESDLQTLMSAKQIPVMIAARNDAVIYVSERKGNVLNSVWFEDLYQNDIAELNKQLRNGIITTGQRSLMREQIIVENVLRDYTKGGKLIEFNGQKK